MDTETENKQDTARKRAWKATAKVLFNSGKKVFIKEISGDIYFGEIKIIDEDSLEIDCFGPPQRAGLKATIYWTLISKITEFKTKEELNGFN